MSLVENSFWNSWFDLNFYSVAHFLISGKFMLNVSTCQQKWTKTNIEKEEIICVEHIIFVILFYVSFLLRTSQSWFAFGGLYSVTNKKERFIDILHMK